MSPRFALPVIALCCALACGDDDDRPTETSTDDDTSVEAPTFDATPDEDAAPERVAGVPALTSAVPSDEARARAEALVKEARALHEELEWEAARAKYAAALEADPSHTTARYWLGSVLVALGERGDALALLGELRALGCEACWDRLREARESPEWKPLRDDSGFEAITEGASGERPASRVVAVLVTEPEDASDEIEVDVVLEPRPGWARAPEIEVVLREKGAGAVRRSPDRRGRTYRARFDVPGRPYSVRVTADGERFATLRATSVDARPEPVVRAPEPPEVEACEGLHCPGYPAMAPDGAYLVTRDEGGLPAHRDPCPPSPTAELTTLHAIRGQRLEPYPSRDLSGYEVLQCSYDAIRGAEGHLIHVDGRAGEIVVSSPEGDVVRRHEPGSMRDLAICPSQKHRTVVVRSAYPAGGDCDPAPGANYELLVY